MKLIIDNIGKIEHAEIEFNGITVLAGENNTGKSTVGKSLYCLFNSCFEIDKYIERQKIARASWGIHKIFESHLPASSEINNPFDDRFTTYFDRYRIKSFFDNSTIEGIGSIIKASLPSEFYNDIDNIDEVVSSISNKIKEIENIPLKSYKATRVSNLFNSVFADQVLNVEHDSGCVKAEIKGNPVAAIFNSSSSAELDLDFVITNQALLLDTPSILDELSNPNYRYYRNNVVKYSLAQKLNSDKNSETMDVDSTINAHKLSKVFELLNKTVPGSFKKSGYEQDKTFLFQGMSKPLKLKNLSQGIKSFLIIKRLCENGQFNERDVLILDEPEINLHPSWQLVYAELVVLLQKEYDLTILLSTHSPYFLSSIETFSKKHNIVDKCKYYLSDNYDNTSFFTDVTGNTEKIYSKLAAPFEVIADIESEMLKEHD